MTLPASMKIAACCALLSLAGCGAPDPSAEPAAGPGGKADGLDGPAQVVVHYPTGYGHRVSLRGGAPLSWERGVDLTWTEGDRWTISLDLQHSVEIKPLFDDEAWAIGPNWRLSPGQTLHLWPRFFHERGTVERVERFRSAILGNERGLWIYLPPSYEEDPARRYPVVYMHDGQNLFFDELAFGGVSWDVGGAMDQGALDGTIAEAIVVGIDNNDARMAEYTPSRDPEYEGGDGDRYLAFIVEELKPQVDAELRTLPEAARTALVGSSLGGLISAHGGVVRPETFGLLGVLSPSTWWDGRVIIDEVRSVPGRPARAARVYVDCGDSGAEDDLDGKPDTDLLVQAYRDVGYRDGRDLLYVVQPGANHSEYFWRQRLPGALSFLLGGR